MCSAGDRRSRGAKNNFIFFFFLLKIVTDTDPGWGEAAFGSTHPVTTDIVDDTREYRVSALGNSHVFQWEQEIWLETVHWNIQQQYTITTYIYISTADSSRYIILNHVKCVHSKLEKKIAVIIVAKCFYNRLLPQKSRDIKLFFFVFSFCLSWCLRPRPVNKFIFVSYLQYVIADKPFSGCMIYNISLLIILSREIIKKKTTNNNIL